MSFKVDFKYRILSKEDCSRIQEIDTSQWIEKAWRRVDDRLQLVTISYMEEGWPDGYEAYESALLETITSGGIAFGVFNTEDKLIGYASLNREFFGEMANYVQLDSIFISKQYRGMGIGKELITRCIGIAKTWGADKLYACAASTEDTIAFYRSMGWVDAIEINYDLLEKDERDLQLEYNVRYN
ncbi:GNAT family N-acetyltransferase [Vallitalea okinawensis]|uniref:GNAT family N-acetyltransferase n=1 Tax=Vallitalea okinawensis TaxID=2078660 RepID=UPI000CFC72F1|nr:GNAT family N-acetyltransferase [Vallitalea okinawensis]